MLKIVTDTLQCLTQSERRTGLVVLALMIFMAFFEVIGVASIMPFLGVLANPQLIDTQPLLARIYTLSGVESREDFLVLLGIAAFLLQIFTAAVRSFSLYAQNRFTQNCRHTLACRLLEGYLRQPYEFFLNRHTGDMGKNILSEVDTFVDRSLVPISYAVSSSLVLVAMAGLLIYVDPKATLLVAASISAIYFALYRIVSGRLVRSGQARAVANRTRFETATEALSGIKTLKVLGREDAYLERFAGGSKVVARSVAKVTLLGQIPKHVIEALAFGGIILAALIAVWRNGADGNLGTLLPMLTLYAFAGYRMLPALHSFYGSVTTLRFASAAVDTIRTELKDSSSGRDATPEHSALPMFHSMELRDVHYSYPGSSAGLRGVSLVLHKGESLGIVGRSGAGKTTLVDVMLGLLVPQAGAVLVDDVPLDAKRRRAWQRSIGYVPQDIFLTEASVAENIALGLLPLEIDRDSVERAARLAQIDEFVTHDLPAGYDTRVGERGVRLSGGQRQRIGIARALYHNPEVIIFDEATSALDSMTEREVMDSVRALSREKTVVVIAHRTGTLAACSRIVQLDRGAVVPPPTGLAGHSHTS